MSADERLDDLLDAWAELVESNPQIDLDAFIREHATELDDDARKGFRKRAAALAMMNQRLYALQETHSFPSDTSEPRNATSLLQELKTGHDPPPHHIVDSSTAPNLSTTATGTSVFAAKKKGIPHVGMPVVGIPAR